MKVKASKRKKIQSKQPYQPVRERTALMKVAVDALKAAGCDIRWKIENVSLPMSFPNTSINSKLFDLRLDVRMRLRPEDIDISTILERADK